MIVDSQLIDILNSLATASEKERIDILESVQPVLSSPEERAKYKRLLEASDLHVVFDCLNASSKEKTQVASNVLGQILGFVSPRNILQKYKTCLLRCMNHPHVHVKVMVLKFFRRCLEVETDRDELILAQNLLVDITRCIADEDGAVAKEVNNFLYSIAALKDSSGTGSLLFSPPILPVLQQINGHEKEAYRLRVSELIITVAKMSPEMTELTSSAGFLQRLVQEMLTDDVLVQLNALEMLSDFAESQHGLAYLEGRGVLRDMDKLLDQSTSSATANYLLPGFIKFFGRVSRNKPAEFVENYPNFSSTIILMLSGDQSGDGSQNLKNLAISTVGHIATTAEGKEKLLRTDSKGKIIGTLVDCLKFGATDEKVTALNAVADILMTATEGRTDLENRSSEAAQKFYNAFANGGMSNLVEHMFSIIKQPFADKSEAAYRIIMNIADKSWGIQKLIDEPGLVEFLLDRNVAVSKQAKEIRYTLIKTMVDNPRSSDGSVVPADLLIRFRRYVNEGPFYVEALTEVALEEG